MKAAEPKLFTLTYTAQEKPVTVELEKCQVTIGRDPSCELVLNVSREMGLSRRHALITHGDAGWAIEDLKSSNGTFVNGLPVGTQPLKDGDQIRLGKLALSFRVPEKRPPLLEEFLRFRQQVEAKPLASFIDMDLLTPARGIVPSPSLREAFAAAADREENQSGANHLISLFSQGAQFLLTNEDLDAMLGKLMDLAFQNLPARRGLLCLGHGSPDKFEVKAIRPESDVGGEKMALSAEIAEEVMRSKKAVLVAASRGRSSAAGDRDAAAPSLMCAPLYHGGNVAGLIYVEASAKAPFTQEHLEVLTALSLLGGLAVKQVRLREELMREQLFRDRLSRYSSPAVVSRMARNTGSFTADMIAEERIVSVIFADLSGFTSRSEKMSPGDVARFLNKLFERFTDVIFHNEGTLDKYLGDGLMAIFGAPLPQPDHAQRAVATALQMQTEVQLFNQNNPATTPVALRVGINSGPVIAGDIGSPKRKDYTVIGDTVNVASRLESMVAQPGQVVIGPGTFELVQSTYQCHPLSVMALKGKQLPVQSFLVTDLLEVEMTTDALRAKAA
ncbi:MAG: FHA domain-containing protein [Gemmataceae bacterium]|nr:FHA domain-containing protein [Gemmataceae bacterium]